jgi:hypothetical protein
MNPQADVQRLVYEDEEILTVWDKFDDVLLAWFDFYGDSTIVHAG